MGKYILYLIIAFIIAFGLHFFQVVHIPGFDRVMPLPDSADYYRGGSERHDKAAQEALEVK